MWYFHSHPPPPPSFHSCFLRYLWLMNTVCAASTEWCVFMCFFPSSIMGVLSNKCGFQLQYQMIFSIWLLAFSPQMCEYLRRCNIVPVLSDILQESVKEKVTRIILATFRVSAGHKHESFVQRNVVALNLSRQMEQGRRSTF